MLSNKQDTAKGMGMIAEEQPKNIPKNYDSVLKILTLNMSPCRGGRLLAELTLGSLLLAL